jgi:hypothetical protein
MMVTFQSLWIYSIWLLMWAMVNYVYSTLGVALVLGVWGGE